MWNSTWNICFRLFLSITIRITTFLLRIIRKMPENNWHAELRQLVFVCLTEAGKVDKAAELNLFCKSSYANEPWQVVWKVCWRTGGYLNTLGLNDAFILVRVGDSQQTLLSFPVQSKSCDRTLNRYLLFSDWHQQKTTSAANSTSDQLCFPLKLIRLCTFSFFWIRNY